MLLKKRKVSERQRREKLVRDTVEKYKQVNVFGLKEKKIISRIQRKEKEKPVK